MRVPFKILSTDFDGTLHTDLEFPRVPHDLQDLISSLQAKGVVWVINTGRDLPSLLESMEHAELSVAPDYIVTVEREIHAREGDEYRGVDDWNQACHEAHQELFARVKDALPPVVDWIRSRYEATVYEDLYSPFCLIARNPDDAEAIHAFLDGFAVDFPALSVVRNDIYARFSHAAYHKGSALSELGRRLGVGREQIAAAGDHLNDLPMLTTEHARWLIAPANAVDAVKEAVRRQNGYVSSQPYGNGLARGLEHLLETNSAWTELF